MKTPHRILCLGDSITRCKMIPEKDKWTVILDQKLEGWRPGRYAVYGLGVAGNTTADALARFVADLEKLLPATVLIEFGLNDCTVPDGFSLARVPLPAFRLHLAELARLVRRSGGEPVLLTNHPPRQPKAMRNLRPYQTAIRSLARSDGSWLVDVERGFMGRKFAGEALLAKDGVHLTSAGSRLYADIVYGGLLPLLERVSDRGTR